MICVTMTYDKLEGIQKEKIMTAYLKVSSFIQVETVKNENIKNII